MLYLTAESMAAPKLDGNDVIKVETIERKPFVCTNDLVRVDPDGRITYLGRANRFFMREEGRKYESGRVETEFSRLKDIEGCAIVPVYHKVSHDTIPMLCVKTLEGAGDPKEVIYKALCRVFIGEKTLAEEDLPSRVMLAETLPRNANGKIDLQQLNSGKVSGDIYTVEPVREQDRLTNFSLTPYQNDPGDIVEQVLEGITADFKNRKPGNEFIQNMKNRTPMTEYNQFYENFDSMCYMHQQMVDNMIGMIGRWFPWNNRYMPFGRTSEKKSNKKS